MGVKRARTDDSLQPASAASSSKTLPESSAFNATTSSTFRNVSACNRCRQRKNRCDQKLPACSLCAKAGVNCVGFDPITKRAIPRTYVYYLESRLSYLETLLADNGIPYAASEDFDVGAKSSSGQLRSQSPSGLIGSSIGKHKTGLGAVGQPGKAWGQEQDEEHKLNRLVSNIGMVSVQGTSDPRYLGSTSGISFARVVFASIKDSVTAGPPKRDGVREPFKPAATANRSTVRDTILGGQPKPTIEPAPFPDQEVGARLVALYFEHANPQIPILHRGEFMAIFHRAYASTGPPRSAREIYMLNIVFAIGAGTIMEVTHTKDSSSTKLTCQESASSDPGKFTASGEQHQPEEYHAAAMVHLDSFLRSMATVDEPDGVDGGLEELQALLLLAGFALLRPVGPGLWYVSGVATRLAVDLGLHHEDGTDLDDTGMVDQQRAKGTDSAKTPPSEPCNVASSKTQQRGRREWLRDLRRRLWWCVYSFDRLVSTCVGRPFGITDQVITTDFPSVLDDEEITRHGFRRSRESFHGPCYKRVSHHYFRLRLLQSEILQVLQYRQAKQTLVSSGQYGNEYMHNRLSSPFLQPFESFRAWRQDMDQRLYQWKEDAPQQEDIAAQFSVQFLELNYWQAIIMLYRQSLSGPPNQASQANTLEDLDSSMSMGATGDAEDEHVYLKIAEAGQKVLMLYRQLHRIHLVNYTYLATVHLFMAGIAFLYVLWHSPTVRSRLTLDDVDFTVLAATSVLGDLIDKCPPAEACRDAFERMSRATINMCLSTTGFGSQSAGFVAQGRPEVSQAASNRPSRLQQQGELQWPPAYGHMHLQRHPSENLPDMSGNFGNGRLEQGQAASHPAMSPVIPPQHRDHDPLGDFSIPEQRFDSLHKRPAPPSIGVTGFVCNDPVYGQYDPATDDKLDALLAGNDFTIYDDRLGTHLGFGDQHEWSDGVRLDMFDGFFFGGSDSGGYVS